MQVTPHPPQDDDDESCVTHPVPESAQSPYPDAHAYEHRPPVQPMPVVLTWANCVQSVVQDPQEWMSASDVQPPSPAFSSPPPSATMTIAPSDVASRAPPSCVAPPSRGIVASGDNVDSSPLSART